MVMFSKPEIFQLNFNHYTLFTALLVARFSSFFHPSFLEYKAHFPKKKNPGSPYFHPPKLFVQEPKERANLRNEHFFSITRFSVHGIVLVLDSGLQVPQFQ